MSTPALPSGTLRNLENAVLVKQFHVASVTLLVYDYLLTIHYEAKFIWPWKWGAGKVLYLCTRYLAFVDITIFLIYWFDQDLDYRMCNPLISAGSWLLWAGVTIAQWIISIRTYALYGRSKKIGAFLLFFNVAIEIPTIILLNDYLKKLIYVPSPIPSIITCFTAAPRSVLYIDYALIMTLELCIIILTLWKGVSQWRTIQSPLFATLYRDGITFFLCLFAISLANFLLYAISQSLLLELLLPELQRILHSVLTARIILHLRAAAADNTEANTLTSMYFNKTHLRQNTTGGTDDTELSDIRTASSTIPTITVVDSEA